MSKTNEEIARERAEALVDIVGEFNDEIVIGEAEPLTPLPYNPSEPAAPLIEFPGAVLWSGVGLDSEKAEAVRDQLIDILSTSHLKAIEEALYAPPCPSEVSEERIAEIEEFLSWTDRGWTKEEADNAVEDLLSHIYFLRHLMKDGDYPGAYEEGRKAGIQQVIIYILDKRYPFVATEIRDKFLPDYAHPGFVYPSPSENQGGEG
jgi:hypothetical protein